MADTQSKEVTVTGLTFQKISVSFDKSTAKVSGMKEKTSDGRFKPINPVGDDFSKIIQQDSLVTEYNINKFKGNTESYISDSSEIEKLPEEQRELVRLAFYNGWSHSKIAADTNLPLGTVKSRLRLAFSRLRNELEGRL